MDVIKTKYPSERRGRRAVGSARCRPPRSRGPRSRPRCRRATRAPRASARVPPGRSPTALRSAVARDPPRDSARGSLIRLARASPPDARVLADAASGTFDDLEVDQEKYSWRVGGPNDIPCVHLRDVYRGEKPLEPRPSPFCTKSSCPVSIGDRTPLSLNRTFVSEDDRVLLKSMAFGCVSSSTRRRERPPPHARARPPIAPPSFSPHLPKSIHQKRRKSEPSASRGLLLPA